MKNIFFLMIFLIIPKGQAQTADDCTQQRLQESILILNSYNYPESQVTSKIEIGGGGFADRSYHSIHLTGKSGDQEVDYAYSIGAGGCEIGSIYSISGSKLPIAKKFKGDCLKYAAEAILAFDQKNQIKGAGSQLIGAKVKSSKKGLLNIEVNLRAPPQGSRWGDQYLYSVSVQKSSCTITSLQYW